MELDLSGRRALVTGASSGIGAAVATWLAREGAWVAVGGRDRARTDAVVHAIRGEGGSAVAAPGDVSSDEGARSVADAAIEAFGGVDILVNNAGGPSNAVGTSDWMEAGSAEWLDTYSKNTVAAVRLIRLLAPAMTERKWGRLIQIGSATGSAPSSGLPQYAASKASILNLTMSVSQALARTGVTANTVSPGMIRTPAVDQWLEQLASESGRSGDRAVTEAWVLESRRPQTVNRVGEVEDIAAVVAFLSSPLADFINGANIRVDGGNATAMN